MAQQPIESQELLINCLPHVHLYTGNGERSFSQFRGGMWLACQVPQPHRVVRVQNNRETTGPGP